MNKFVKAAAAALAAAAIAALAGCNTVEGLGQDLKKGAEHVGAAVEKAGDAISDTAAKASGKSAE